MVRSDQFRQSSPLLEGEWAVLHGQVFTSCRVMARREVIFSCGSASFCLSFRSCRWIHADGKSYQE